ncbi:MAG: Integration host factor subunit alpha [Alphaproteobacteria bacterium MarineAlpha5_Bin9]|nr:MAG: Integration host factor subunit alpha [Alphaproteobacteria bacterium MarineAlpha5_Bin9]|tara:strand:- start:9322 stop:9618 length:297 start_codon:yes stop_codon:yes gene_type:complete
MSKNITRDDISEFLLNEFGLSKKDCSDLVNDIIEEIILGLIKDDYVKIHNFGTFKVKSKNSRLGRNPKTKIEVMIPSRKVISFIPSKHLLKKINKENE